MALLVITAIGPDRPGLVGKFTGLLLEGRVNLADSRMVNLRGQFALIALVEGEEHALEAMRGSLPGAVKELGLSVAFSGEAREVSSPGKSKGIPYRMKTYSTDRPGLVHRITEVLGRYGLNIEDLETRLETAPFAGTTVATVEIRLHIPPTVKVKRLREELEALADDLNYDFDLEPS
jgi:glycine cleavage system transcriptional repressor